MSQLLDDLLAMYALIEKPENWTTEAGARDRDGVSLGDWNSPHAVSFCINGVALRVIGIVMGIPEAPKTQRWREIVAALRQLIPNPESNDIPYDTARYNNSHTHAEVLAWLNRAMEAERRRERWQEVINDLAKVPVSAALLSPALRQFATNKT